MKTNHTRSTLSLFLIILFYSFLHGQAFQQRYAYNPGPGLEKGYFWDVTTLPSFASNNVNIITIGASTSTPNVGVLGFHNSSGVPILYQTFYSTSAYDITGKSITKTPSGDIIACFFDRQNFATDIVRTTPTGVIVWKVRLPNFNPFDVDSDLISAYAGGEGIWITGVSSSDKVAVAGLTGNGNLVFSKEFSISHPSVSYTSNLGFGIKYDPYTNKIVVIGQAIPAGPASSEMIMLRITPSGTWSLGKTYAGNGGRQFFFGRDLVAHPSFPGDFVISFDHSSILNQETDQAALMQIDTLGNPVWMNSYSAPGSITQPGYFQNHGIDTDGATFLSSGDFFNQYTSQPNGYTMATDLSGNPIQMTEYQSNTPYWSSYSILGHLEYNTATEHYSIAGFFPELNQTPFSTHTFWVISTTTSGLSTCSSSFTPEKNQLESLIFNLDHYSTSLPELITSPILSQGVDSKYIPQCFYPKRLEDFGAEGAAAIKFGYAADRSQIIIDIAGELTAQGTLELMDLQGKTLLKTSLKSGKQYLDASSLSRGIYMLRYQLTGIQNGVKKISIN